MTGLVKILYAIPILILLLPSSVPAQNPDRDYIKNSDEFYYGTGVSKDIKEAEDLALEELTKQISVNVSSWFEEKISQRGDKLDESVESIIRTHSAATLRNVKKIKKQLRGGRIEVFSYLEKSNVEKIFEDRRKLISDMFRNAGEYADELNISDALKLSCFAAILLKSLPDPNVVYDGVNYTIEIPKFINAIINNVELRFAGDEFPNEKERIITFQAEYGGKPVVLLDFTFWDGSNVVSVRARDGQAVFSLLGSSVRFEKLNVNIKYDYYECRREFKPIEELWKVVNRPEFNSRKLVYLTGRKSVYRRPPVAGQDFNITLECEDDAPAESVIDETNRFLKLLPDQNIDLAKKCYSEDTFLTQKVSNYIRYNRAQPLSADIQAQLNRTGDGWELRRIPVKHRYPGIHTESIEYLVLDFDKDGRFMDLNVSICENLYEKFVKEGGYGGDWGNRQEIIKFLEKYRSAYLTRDDSTVGMLYADEAIIILGRMLKKKSLSPGDVRYEQLDDEQPDVEYIRYNKTVYLEKLKEIFDYQDDFFLHFGSFNITKKNNCPNVYGVEMRQSYAVTTYADEGYLFLLIDFNGQDPLIYVRAWQPNAWSEAELIRTSNFKIHCDR